MHPRTAIGVAAIVLVASGCAASQAATGTQASTLAPVTTLPDLLTTTTVVVVPETMTTTTTTRAPLEEGRGRLVVNGVGDVNLDPTFVRSFPSTGYEDA